MNTTDTGLQTFVMEHAARENAAQPCWYVEIWAPGEQDRPRYVTPFYNSRGEAMWDAEHWLNMQMVLRDAFLDALLGRA